jgi:sugar phosphate isomerase/epimerase
VAQLSPALVTAAQHSTMQIDQRHLTYCTNVHAGETWPELRDQVLPRVRDVKAQLAAPGAFGVGLRVSAAAAAALREPAARAELAHALARDGLYVFTLNAFPFGAFHAAPVKEGVYEPDWRDARRLAYTNHAAELLASLLPEHVAYGSISSVPLGFRPSFAQPGAVPAAADNLLAHVAFLHELKQRTGRRIVLALEPEPCCALETIDDCLDVFERELYGARACSELAARTGCDTQTAQDVLREHLGLCLDACHAAVEFEDPSELLTRLRAAQLPIFKVQLSAGLCAPELSAQRLEAFGAFAEDVYLHQVVERRAGALRRYLDLPEALAAARPDTACEWRVHFHVPIFRRELGCFESTQPFLAELLRELRPADCAHLEVETYTWSVLPPALRATDLARDIANELSWARAQLAPGSGAGT